MSVYVEDWSSSVENYIRLQNIEVMVMSSGEKSKSHAIASGS
jgi:hypothetical protein